MTSSRSITACLGDRIIRALRDGGARLVLGTDTGNPLVVPGFTVHEELELLVNTGLTPYEALRAGTRNAAELMGAARESGTVAVGQRADLLLVEGNPLTDVAQAGRIAGVMARGRWLDARELAGLLDQAEAFAQGRRDPFAALPTLAGEGPREFAGDYEITWKDVPFGVERVLVTRALDGQRVIRAATFDPHRGQGFTLSLWAGAASAGERLLLESDGAKGRGRAEVKREGAGAHLRGTLLSGAEATLDAALPEAALLGVDGFLAGKLLLGPRLGALEVGQTLQARAGEVALGSAAEMTVGSWTIIRTSDTTVAAGAGGAQVAARRYEIAPEKGAPGVLLLDEKGWPLGYELAAFGATVRFRRVSL